MYEAKERSYKVGRNIILMLSVLAFFVLFVFAPEVSHLILGEIEGGNTIRDVAFVIRSVSFCLLIIPFLSVSKGYLQGHNYITPAGISQVIEQVVRIAVILFGSYIVISVLGKSVTLGVGISVFVDYVVCFLACLACFLQKIYGFSLPAYAFCWCLHSLWCPSCFPSCPKKLRTAWHSCCRAFCLSSFGQMSSIAWAL